MTRMTRPDCAVMCNLIKYTHIDTHIQAADATGVAAGKPPPREDVASANEVGAAPDENMGGMPPPRGAADAAGVAAGKPPPREDVASANEVGAAPDENMGGMPPPTRSC